MTMLQAVALAVIGMGLAVMVTIWHVERTARALERRVSHAHRRLALLEQHIFSAERVQDRK
jgi:type II secretory pathway component PulL